MARMRLFLAEENKEYTAYAAMLIAIRDRHDALCKLRTQENDSGSVRFFLASWSCSRNYLCNHSKERKEKNQWEVLEGAKQIV